MNLKSLYSLSLLDLRQFLLENGKSQFVADQIFNWVYRQFKFDPEDWSNVSDKVKNFITLNLDLSLPKIIWQGKSVDGTRKFLLQMNDKKTVESVIIPAKNRLTICLSSQVGCAIGCTFCHTGTMGLTRHLGAHEVVGQVLSVGQWLLKEVGPEQKITNMVYMGQGEPLHNYDNMKKATHVFMEDKGLAYGQRRITLSTSGLVPQIEKLVDFPPVNIAISLHAAHDNIRTELMPINKVYDLKRLFEAIKKIPLKSHRRITYEYLLIKDLNDRLEDIQALEQLIDSRESKINLIPFNEYPDSKFKRPSAEKIVWFQDEMSARGFVCTVRATKGQDILAACGQLKSEYEKINLWQEEAVAIAPF